MNQKSASLFNSPQSSEMQVLQHHWGWFLSLGMALIVLGATAISLPLLAALTIEILLGWILVISGLTHVTHAFWERRWRGFMLELLSGILYLVIGLILLAYPLQGVLTLTLLLAIFLIIEGGFKIILAWRLRPLPNWGWALVSGLIALLLGVMIWGRWPTTATWVIGLFIGIDLIFGGWSMVMVALTARRASLLR